MYADLVALLALSAGVSCVVDAALPVRPESPTNDNNDQIPNGNHDQQVQPDVDEFWSHAFSAILSQDASAESQRINPDDWRRYVREAHDLPEGLSSMFGIDAHAEKEEAAQTNANANSNTNAEEQNRPSWNPGHNRGGDRRRFLHVDEIPPLPVEQHPRLLQALTLDDLLDPVGPPPPGAATTSTGNDDDNNRAKVPQPYGNGGGYGNDYRPQYNYDDKDDELNYRWQQGDAEVPGYDNAVAGPGGIMTKKDKKKDRKKDKKKDRKDKDKEKVPDYYYPHNSYYPNGGGDPYYKPRSGTYVNCPYGSALQVMRIGYPVCLDTNEILCKDGWKFGVIQTGYGNHTESHLELRRDNSDNERMVDLVYRKLPTANSLCIAEHHQNVAVLSVGVEDGTWYLACPNAGNPNKLPRLKIVEDADSGDRHQLVVRFRDGAGEDDTLWELFANGKTETASDCAWFFITNAVPTPVPSSSPTVSASPSSSPSVSPTDLPSASPSTSPSTTPSLHPSALPSLLPSATPSIDPTVSMMPSDNPSSSPSANPTISSAPTEDGPSPSASPSSDPSIAPSGLPSSRPSSEPSSLPSPMPSSDPSNAPTVTGSGSPSSSPSVAPSNSPSVTASATPTSILSPINITMILGGDPLIEDYRNIFDLAVARWSDIILGDLPDFPNDGNQQANLGPNADLFDGRLSFTYTNAVDDLVIGAQLEDFDENDAIRPSTDDCSDPLVNGLGGYCRQSRTVGSAGPSVTQRFGDNTRRNTVAGVMRFDRLNFKCCGDDTERRLTVLHEMAHVLGIGIYDSSGASFDTGGPPPPLSFQRFCRQNPATNSIVANYNLFVPNPPASLNYWNGVDPAYKTNYANGALLMEDCVNEGCGSGSRCSHWEIEMFPNQANLPTGFIQSQELMAYSSRGGWAQVITGLSLGILSEVGYDDGVNVRVDLSKADPYPTPVGFTNRGDEHKMLIPSKDIDWTQMMDEPPPIDVERTR